MLAPSRQAGHAAGLATWRRGEPVRKAWVPDNGAEPRFLAYSITKTCLAVLLLQLAEQGRLDLEAPVAPLVPQLGWSSAATARQLLQHTAGLPDYGGLRAYHDAVRTRPGQPWSTEDFVRESLRRPPLFAPGEGWAYANPGYMVLRLLVERLHGEPLAAVFRRHLAQPLGLARTGVVAQLEDMADMADLAPAPSATITGGTEPLDVRGVYHPGWVSHGVIAGPPSELLRFLLALLSGELLDAASLRRMLSPVAVPGAPPGWPNAGYGLGLMMAQGPGGTRLAGHGGGGPGYTAGLFALLDDSGPVAAACAMCAGEAVQAEGIAREMLGLPA